MGRSLGPSRPVRPCASWTVATPQRARPFTTSGIGAADIRVDDIHERPPAASGVADCPPAPPAAGNCNSRPGIRNCGHEDPKRPRPGATPNLRHLMLFDQVVRRGSVSAAARAAHLSQPAVTQAVRHIEAALGARLLNRSYSGLALTEAGRAAAQRVDRALQMLREALLAARGRPAGGVHADVLRGITSTQLNALIAVVEQGAFARAARRAGRARTAVHRAARQLERPLARNCSRSPASACALPAMQKSSRCAAGWHLPRLPRRRPRLPPPKAPAAALP